MIERKFKGECPKFGTISSSELGIVVSCDRVLNSKS
jgi:hypothetical protein